MGNDVALSTYSICVKPLQSKQKLCITGYITYAWMPHMSQVSATFRHHFSQYTIHKCWKHTQMHFSALIDQPRGLVVRASDY
jgi:hypothetical protein